MLKKILSLVLIISFFSVGFCFAFDTDSIKTKAINFWNDCLPEITECWNKVLTWINTDAKPWIEKNLGADSRKEFEREFTEAMQEVPNTIKAVWDKAIELFN